MTLRVLPCSPPTSFEIVSAPAGAGAARGGSAAPAARLPSATLDRLEARRHRHRRPLEPETDQLTKQQRRRVSEVCVWGVIFRNIEQAQCCV